MRTEPCDSINAPNLGVSPSGNVYASHDLFSDHGLTKREYFAAMALIGLAPNIAINWTEPEIASRCVVMADALIKELNEQALTPFKDKEA